MGTKCSQLGNKLFPPWELFLVLGVLRGLALGFSSDKSEKTAVTDLCLKKNM
jgi:hypothetical protein